MIQQSQIRSRRFVKLLILVAAVASIGIYWAGTDEGDSPSARDIADQLQLAGINCTPGEVVTSESGSAVREGLPCVLNDVIYEITTYPNQQATDEVTRFVLDNAGCQLALSRESTQFTLLIGAKFSIFVATVIPTGIEIATSTTRVFKDGCAKTAI